jgi:hypothetical protein
MVGFFKFMATSGTLAGVKTLRVLTDSSPAHPLALIIWPLAWIRALRNEITGTYVCL